MPADTPNSWHISFPGSPCTFVSIPTDAHIAEAKATGKDCNLSYIIMWLLEISSEIWVEDVVTSTFLNSVCLKVQHHVGDAAIGCQSEWDSGCSGL